ncbi:MAG: hypothetical protein H7288_17050 [Kineosporiaceae bacterium]|nr:hypothetical protein [Aeromicrobium sp.]
MRVALDGSGSPTSWQHVSGNAVAGGRCAALLFLEGRGYREVVEIAGCSHRDVARVRQGVQERGLTSAVEITDTELAKRFPDGRRRVSEEYDQPVLSRALASMKQNRHFTLLLAWRR